MVVFLAMTVSGGPVSEAVPPETVAPSPVALANPFSRGQRTADRVLERRVREALRADPFLALAVAQVKVTSRQGVVRLVGRVRTAKERSSIAFKAGQIGRVDDRVTIGYAW